MSNFEIQYLATQYGLLAATIFFYRKLIKNDNQREQRTVETEVKKWCKCVLRSGSGSPGELQRAGQKARERFPEDINLILQSYDELLVEEPNLKLPALYKFLENMEGIEKGKWPESSKAFTGKLKLYK